MIFTPIIRKPSYVILDGQASEECIQKKTPPQTLNVFVMLTQGSLSTDTHHAVPC